MSTRRVYVLTVHSPDKRHLRVWTGKSLHTLRHCSVKQIDHALMEIHQHVDEFQRTIRATAPSGSYSLNRSR
jgi:hypothetical protein